MSGMMVLIERKNTDVANTDVSVDWKVHTDVRTVIDEREN
jgi:hypothetical protein